MTLTRALGYTVKRKRTEFEEWRSHGRRFAGDLPNVIAGDILCPSLHFSYRFIVLR